MAKDSPTLAALRQMAAAGPPYAADWLKALGTDPRQGARAVHASCLRRIAKAEAAAARREAMFAFETEARGNGFSRVAGVDEAGRGPLAGPIVAGAAVLREPVSGLDDSKLLSAEQRDTLYAKLMEGGHTLGIAIIEAPKIDQGGIQAANYGVMAKAVGMLDPAPDFLLIDGFEVPGMEQPQQRLIKGDRRSYSIAAASILAKVTRDRIMDEWNEQYPQYGFSKHKGYGTREHLDAIAKYGPCPAHRMSFAPLAEKRETGELF